jgi:hypothetical protein
MTNRPILPPLDYRLWLPHCGTYVRATRQNNRWIIGTINRAEALRLPEPQAIAQARTLIRRAGQVIELRPVNPGEAATQRSQP